jgi:hypothetical protein
MNPTTEYNFKKISDKNGTVIFYTNPSKSKPNTDDIVAYYEDTLKQIGNKKWVWIFDSDGFSIKHATEVSMGTEITKLVTEKYAHNLQEIKIINPTWHIKTMLKALWPFTNEHTKQKIKILDDKRYSVLEFI